jgi:hypothetical protein
MSIRLVQLAKGDVRRVALVEEPRLLLLEQVGSIYELASQCIAAGIFMSERARALAGTESVSYDEVYEGRSSWRLLSPIDVPGMPSRTLVAGTGLTHLGSARERQAMHLADQPKQAEVEMTDSMRMFQWGVDNGRPAAGQAGVAPEWFYKGDGSVVRAPFESLRIPFHAEDGGEEAELAGIYIVGEDGTPYRIGITTGNEFSDHKFEKRNYLNLAGSKLRDCSLGPELVIGVEFTDVKGEVSIERDGKVIWNKKIASGEHNMCHSLANMEHHHFKFAGHRQPGSVHVHFFGADALSFGQGIVLQDGDMTEVRFDGFGRPLRTTIAEEARSSSAVVVRSLA